MKPRNEKFPTAPPVYRPAPVPRVLQPRMAQSSTRGERARENTTSTWKNLKKPSLQMKVNAAPGVTHRGPAPVAPPVYRPQPTPHVLQKKVRPGIGPAQAHVYRPDTKMPTAPKVYRVERTRVAQPKRIAPPPAIQKANAAVVQRAELSLLAAGGAAATGILAVAAIGYGLLHCLRGRPDQDVPAGPPGLGGAGGVPAALPAHQPVVDPGDGGGGGEGGEG